MMISDSATVLSIPLTLPLSETNSELRALMAEVMDGLTRAPKSLPSKLFYDREGSRLFSRICQTEEYYLTRAEMKLLKAIQGQLGAFLDGDFNLLEYGCGSSDKVSLILEAVPHCKAYAAIDICRSALSELTGAISASHPGLRVISVCEDFMHFIQVPWNGTGHLKKMAFFPGSSIGNFRPEEAVEFMRGVGEAVGASGSLLVGVDTKKDELSLHAAYNDAQGLTAEFNKNILRRINRECGANFKLDNFEHVAFYNEAVGRVEMHLKSLVEQKVAIGGISILFEKGETIHTENAYKYEPSEFQLLAKRAGWRSKHCWIDKEELYSLHYLEWEEA